MNFQITNAFHTQPGPEVYPKLQDLPEECIREIILRINDHRDLESSSAAWTLMAALASEQRVWRELTQFHFNQNQIDLITATQMNSMDGRCENKEPNGGTERRKDWQKIYHALRRYGEIRIFTHLHPIRFLFVVIAENTAYARIINIRKFWHCVDFVAAYFGPRPGIRASHSNRRIFGLV